MTRPVDVIWRSLLVLLLLTLSVLLNLPWVEANLKLTLREQENSRVERAYAQSGFQIARGDLEMTLRLAGAFQNRKLPGSWLLSFYGPALLLGIVLSLYMRSARILAVALLGIVVLALVLIGLQWLWGLPLVAQVEEFNRACREDPRFNDPGSIFAAPPEMTLVGSSIPWISAGLLLLVGVVGAFGLRRPGVEVSANEQPGQSLGSSRSGTGGGPDDQAGPARSTPVVDAERSPAGERADSALPGRGSLDERVVEHPPLSGGNPGGLA